MSDRESDKGPLLLAAVLWEHTDKTGQRILRGRLGQMNVLVFPTREATRFELFFGERPGQQIGEQRDRADG